MKTFALLAALSLAAVTPAFADSVEADQPPFGLSAENLHTAWRHSCRAFTRFPADKPLSKTDPRFRTYGDWQTLCSQTAAFTADQTLNFFNSSFSKVKIDAPAKFTAYYKPLLTGTTVKMNDAQTPLLAWPESMASCHKIDPSPCPTRGEIETALDSGPTEYKTLLWLDNPIDAYLLHIQGSGTVRLPNGEARHVGFAGKNGHPYVAVGKVLKDWGELTGDITIDKIRKWIEAHPERRAELFHNNPSYIFFKVTKTEAPGAFGIPVTSGRSLAIDRSLTPLGVPLLVKTTLNKDGSQFNRIAFAQDVGSAIKGPARVDLYLGHGHVAGDYAGDQNSSGELFYLLPKAWGSTLAQ